VIEESTDNLILTKGALKEKQREKGAVIFFEIISFSFRKRDF